MLSDLINSLKKPNLWGFTTWFRFLIRYRRTAIGPLWIIASPVLFIVFLGALFVGLSQMSTSEFIPHLTIGLVVWTLLGGLFLRSPDIFIRNKSYLMQGKITFTDIVLIDNAELVVHFFHQTILIVAVCWYYDLIHSGYFLISFLGLFILVINGFWLSLVLGILGARFKDIWEIVGALVSIAFLATPIIWMPTAGNAIGGKGSILERYMTYNPFYHFLEIIRAPLMGNPISDLTWTVVACFTVLGFIIASYMYKKYRHMIVFWA